MQRSKPNHGEVADKVNAFFGAKNSFDRISIPYPPASSWLGGEKDSGAWLRFLSEEPFQKTESISFALAK